MYFYHFTLEIRLVSVAVEVWASLPLPCRLFSLHPGSFVDVPPMETVTFGFGAMKRGSVRRLLASNWTSPAVLL